VRVVASKETAFFNFNSWDLYSYFLKTKLSGYFSNALSGCKITVFELWTIIEVYSAELTDVCVVAIDEVAILDRVTYRTCFNFLSCIVLARSAFQVLLRDELLDYVGETIEGPVVNISSVLYLPGLFTIISYLVFTP
jgi:hypothetical protein